LKKKLIETLILALPSFDKVLEDDYYASGVIIQVVLS